MATILITGAAGSVGGFLRERLTGHELRLTDVAAGGDVEALDVTDQAAVDRLVPRSAAGPDGLPDDVPAGRTRSTGGARRRSRHSGGSTTTGTA